MRRRALFERLPALANRVPLAPLGEFPTPVTQLLGLPAALGVETETWVKRDDLSSPLYGGNKVRTLEVLFAAARAAGADRIVATGAFGTNHGLATVVHAPRAGLEAGLVLYPQPPTADALANFRVLCDASVRRTLIPHWSTLPVGMLVPRAWPGRSVVMVPGGATALGALAYISAGIELAEQVAEGRLPAPRLVIVGVGSNCTSAGLLVGFHLAARWGLGLRTPPMLRAVRITPWPVTSRYRIVGLALESARLLERLTGEPAAHFDRNTLSAGLQVDGSQIGSGYGEVTPAGLDAVRLMHASEALAVDTTYTAKSSASLIAALRGREPGPILYWHTRSSAALPLPALPSEGLAGWWARRVGAPRIAA
jgi:D-cysteine desulfhydrase